MGAVGVPDQQESDQAAAAGRPVPVVTPAVAVLVGALVLLVVAAFIVLTVLGHDPSAFVLLVGAPVLTTIVGAILTRQVHQVEDRARIIQEQTNGQLTTKLDALHDHIRLEARSIRRVGVGPLQEPAGSSLPSQRTSAGPTRRPDQEPPMSSVR